MAPEDAIAIVTYVCVVLTCVSVFLRTLVRCRWFDAGLRSDDWLIIVALIFYLIFCAVIIALTVVERRNPILTEPSANLVLLLISIAECLFMITSISFKISLAIFFRRFLLERAQRRLILSVTSLYCVLSVLGFFLGLLPCGAPVDLATKHIEGKCIPVPVWNGLLYTHGVVSALSDWVFALLPILILWKSSISVRNKLGVSLLMVLAVCGSLCAVLRTIYINSLHFDAAYFDPRHPTYYHTTALIINMAVLEMGIGITAASVACLMPLFRHGAALCRRHLPGKLRQQYLSGKQQGCGSSAPEEASSREKAATSQNVRSYEPEDLNLEMLGILPTIDSLTDENKHRNS